jgi:translation initiation factor IF-3
VSPNADPPVAKFLDVGKFKYEAQKKANLARKSQKTQEIKEIKMRPNIDDHDYDTKMKKLNEFIDEGDKVKVRCDSAGASWRTAARHESAAPRSGRCSWRRQGRAASAHGRPADADGAFAK